MTKERQLPRRNRQAADGQIEEVLDALGNPLVVLNANWEVKRANRAFYQVFQIVPEQIRNRHFFQLEKGEWDVPALRRCLEKALEGSAVSQEVEIDRDFPRLGRRVMRLCVRSTDHEHPHARLFVLSIEDITERKRMENAVFRYQKQLQQMVSRLALAEEEERRRIAMDLHDRIGQALSVIQMRVGMLRGTTSSSEQLDALDRIYKLIDQTVRDTRSLTFEINPPMLYTLGLEAALEWLAEHFQSLYGIDITFQDDGQPKSLAEDVRGQLFRSVRELLINVVKHAQANQAHISVRREKNDIHLEIVDNGRGFEPARLDLEEDNAESFGLFSIRERMDSLNGRLQVESAPGKGTRCVLMAPLER